MERHCMCPHRNPLAAVGEQGWRCVRPPSPTGGWIMDGRKICETGMTRCGAMAGVGPASYYGLGCWCADSRPEGASGAWGGRCRGRTHRDSPDQGRAKTLLRNEQQHLSGGGLVLLRFAGSTAIA